MRRGANATARKERADRVPWKMCRAALSAASCARYVLSVTRREKLVFGIVFCVAAGAGSTRAHADEGDVVVTGSSVTGFVGTAKEGEKPRDSADAAALLEGLPGLRVRRLGVDGGFATLSIRGAASSQIAVVVAGIPLTSATDPSVDLATLPLWPGAVAHVHRTFAPAALGGGYLGGVVSFDPLSTSGPDRTELYDAVGSFGALRMRIADVRTISGNSGSTGISRPNEGGSRWVLATGLSASRIGGGFLYVDPSLGPGNEVDRERTNAGSAQVSGMAQARGDFDQLTILLTALGVARRDGVAGTFLHPTTATRLERERALFAVEIRRPADDGRWIGRVFVRREVTSFSDPLGENGFGLTGTSFSGVTAVGAMIGRSLRLGERFVLDVRLDGEMESSAGSRVYGPLPDRRRTRTGLGTDVTYRVSERVPWTLLAAGRVDLRRDVAAEGGDNLEALPAGHLGAEVALSEHAILAAHAGALARPPSFLELLGDGGATEASPNLRSERALAFDVGARLRGPFGKTIEDGAWDAELVVFGARTRDLIVIAPRGLGTLRAENVGDAASYGAEASVGLALGPLRALASYTLLVTRDLTDLASSAGQPLPGRPRHDLTVDVSARLGRFIVRYGLDVVAATPLNRESTLTLPTRTWHGAGVSFTPARGIVTLFEVANIFDQRSGDVLYASGATPTFVRYPSSDFVGYPIPGRRFTLALRISLP